MLFKKKQPALDSLPSEDRWQVSDGTYGGKPIIVRVNANAKDYVGHPEMSVRFGVAVPLKAPDDKGFPGSEELKQLEAVEEALFESVNAAKLGRVVLIITTGGVREFVSYVRSKSDAEEAVNKVRNSIKTHSIQHYSAEDARWDGFREFA